MAAIAPWFRLRLPSCGPGFESQAHHQCFFLKNIFSCLFQSNQGKLETSHRYSYTCPYEVSECYQAEVLAPLQQSLSFVFRGVKNGKFPHYFHNKREHGHKSLWIKWFSPFAVSLSLPSLSLSLSLFLSPCLKRLYNEAAFIVVVSCLFSFHKWKHKQLGIKWRSLPSIWYFNHFCN